MSALVVFGHPRPGSFNHAIAERACADLRASGNRVIFHALHSEGFDPNLPIAEHPADGMVDPVLLQHCHGRAAAEAVMVVHPDRWGMLGHDQGRD
ncbi:MAG: NAD(P)H-dependent oxidoreductase [Armatimonadota bacterium]